MFGTEIKNLDYNDNGNGFKFDCYYKSAWIRDASMPIDAKNVSKVEDRTDFFEKMITSGNSTPSSQSRLDLLMSLQNWENEKKLLLAEWMKEGTVSLSAALCPGLGTV